MYTMDINQRENARCIYIIKYRCLSTLADPAGGGNPARAPLTVADLLLILIKYAFGRSSFSMKEAVSFPNNGICSPPLCL